MINNPVIGIIGGTGSMGKMFKIFFEKKGFIVKIAGRKTQLSVEECAKSSDIVIISVPIDKTVETIENIGIYLREDGLLMDLTSIKVKPVEAMLKYSKCSVLGLHPIFGPGIKNFKNQTIAMCQGRGEEWFNWIKNLFEKSKVRLKICTPHQHDKMMAIIQGLIHFSNITIGYLLKELNIDIKESLEFASPIFKIKLDIIGRILNQDPYLYANIEMKNPEIENVLEKYLNISHELFSIIKKGETEKFIEYFNKASKHIGEYKNEAKEKSNKLINLLMNKFYE